MLQNSFNLTLFAGFALFFLNLGSVRALASALIITLLDKTFWNSNGRSCEAQRRRNPRATA